MKYQIIYADPPWQYETGNVHGKAIAHYPTMPTSEICKLPIGNLSDNPSILFMWATYPKMADALAVIAAWGFEYKTAAFVWVKMNPSSSPDQISFLPYEKVDECFGVGWYTKSNCEPCLLATRGKATTLIKSKSVRSVIFDVRRKHSQKPNEVRLRIIELCGDLPRIELFARQKTDGWDVWGNEIKNDIELTYNLK